MTVRSFFVWIAAAAAVLTAHAADEATDRWIAKARSFVGPEATLAAITSLHFEGSFEGMEQIPDAADPTKLVEKPVKVSIDIVFQRPMQQRQIIRTDLIERITALDDYDGWERVVDLAGKRGRRVLLLDVAGIKRLRATTVENLSFFTDRGWGSRKVQYVGDATLDGVACAKLAFTHSDNITFIRYFDQATGRLMKTEVENGGEIREEGELIVDGVRFPHRVVNKTASGKSTIITFDKVTINQVFPPETFAVPPIDSR